MPERDKSPAAERALTIAHVRQRSPTADVEVMFLESARIYRLPISRPHFESVLAQLTTAKDRDQRVLVHFSADDSGAIDDVRPDHG